MNAASHMQPFPHEPGCPVCRATRRCNVCGDRMQKGESCTNGRCVFCHIDCCTPGGSTSPGHGFGDPMRSRRLMTKTADRIRQGATR